MRNTMKAACAVTGAVLLLAACGGGGGDGKTGLTVKQAVLDTPEDAAGLAATIAAMYGVSASTMQPASAPQKKLSLHDQLANLTPKAENLQPKASTSGSTTTDCGDPAKDGQYVEWTEQRDVSSPHAPGHVFDLDVTRYDACHVYGQGYQYVVNGREESGQPSSLTWTDATRSVWYYAYGHGSQPFTVDYTGEDSSSRVDLSVSIIGRSDEIYPSDPNDPAWTNYEVSTIDQTYKVLDKASGETYEEQFMLRLGQPGQPFKEDWDSNDALSLEGSIAYAARGASLESCGLGAVEISTPVRLQTTAEGTVTGQLRLKTQSHEAFVTFNADGSYTVVLDGAEYPLTAQDAVLGDCGQSLY